VEDLEEMRQEILRKKKRFLLEAMEDEIDLRKKRKPIIRRKIRAPTIFPVIVLPEERKVDEEEEVTAKTEALPIAISKRAVKKLRKVCTVEVCKPEICCTDLKGK